ncbi:hypothetical protein WMY93_016112 [Mugilogobius chulae]|uniref:Uncharacterized protein n=1 Tax=Mugilogobius chulae TaxID=88201 RepID=A0AAW0P378_9GOBI
MVRSPCAEGRHGQVLAKSWQRSRSTSVSYVVLRVPGIRVRNFRGMRTLGIRLGGRALSLPPSFRLEVVALLRAILPKLQIPQKAVVEKPSRALEREALAMQRKNQTYTLLEDSDSDGGGARETKTKKNKRDRDRGGKRRNIRQKKDSESSSEEEPPKK